MKQEFKALIVPYLIPLLIGFSLMALYIIFKPSIYFVLLFVSVMTFVSGVRVGKKPLLVLRSVLINCSWVLLIVFVWRVVGLWGFLGPIIAVLLVAVIILYRRRKVFMSTIRDIEKLIWGKTNDKP